jgi:BMFP domain-containing protein YqiC
MEPAVNQDALISDFLDRLRQQMADALPRDRLDAVVDQARHALRQGLADLDLVSRRELDGHLQALERLTRTVEDLERRIRDLERQ